MCILDRLYDSSLPCLGLFAISPARDPVYDTWMTPRLSSELKYLDRASSPGKHLEDAMVFWWMEWR